MLSCDCLTKLKKCFKIASKKEGVDYVSAAFQTDIRFIFAGFEQDLKKCKGFTSPIRSLLVDNILKNMSFDVFNENEEESLKDTLRNRMLASEAAERMVGTLSGKNKNDVMATVAQKLNLRRGTDGAFEESAKVSKKLLTFSGLPYMLDKKYFEDAFVLHEESSGLKQLNEIMIHMMQDDAYDEVEDVKIFEDLSQKRTSNSDTRSKLDSYWAQPKNMFKFQPLWLIRDYFGETIALYFAWCGTLISSLWIPMFIGLAFFVVGVIESTNESRTFNATTASVSEYGNYYINIFADSFDGYLALPFAVVICLWGAVFTEYWKREQARLSYEWDTENFEKLELDRVEYVQKLQQYCAKHGLENAEFPEYQKYLKYMFSFTVLIFMVNLVTL